MFCAKGWRAGWPCGVGRVSLLVGLGRIARKFLSWLCFRVCKKLPVLCRFLAVLLVCRAVGVVGGRGFFVAFPRSGGSKCAK